MPHGAAGNSDKEDSILSFLKSLALLFAELIRITFCKLLPSGACS